MQVNVKNAVRVKEGDEHLVLLAAKNPHGVSDKTGKMLVKEKLATEHVVVEEPDDDTEIALEDMKVDALKDIAKGLEVEGFANLKKDELVAEIKAKRATQDDAK